jgi:hypothetical protein
MAIRDGGENVVPIMPAIIGVADIISVLAGVLLMLALCVFDQRTSGFGREQRPEYSPYRGAGCLGVVKEEQPATKCH